MKDVYIMIAIGYFMGLLTKLKDDEISAGAIVLAAILSAFWPVMVGAELGKK